MGSKRFRFIDGFLVLFMAVVAVSVALMAGNKVQSPFTAGATRAAGGTPPPGAPSSQQPAAAVATSVRVPGLPVQYEKADYPVNDVMVASSVPSGYDMKSVTVRPSADTPEIAAQVDYEGPQGGGFNIMQFVPGFNPFSALPSFEDIKLGGIDVRRALPLSSIPELFINKAGQWLKFSSGSRNGAPSMDWESLAKVADSAQPAGVASLPGVQYGVPEAVAQAAPTQPSGSSQSQSTAPTATRAPVAQPTATRPPTQPTAIRPPAQPVVATSPAPTIPPAAAQPPSQPTATATRPAVTPPPPTVTPPPAPTRTPLPTAVALPPTPTPSAVPARPQGVDVHVAGYEVTDRVTSPTQPSAVVTPTAGYKFLIVRLRTTNNLAYDVVMQGAISALHGGNLALRGLQPGALFVRPTLDARSGQAASFKLGVGVSIDSHTVAFEIPNNADPNGISLNFDLVWSGSSNSQVLLVGP
ncbi:MAG: hypothetical protein FJ319_12240 [SAR202 cluster bacterium]|nr:hypothetical protein [SAR202 cluster bacterium]